MAARRVPAPGLFAHLVTPVDHGRLGRRVRPAPIARRRQGWVFYLRPTAARPADLRPISRAARIPRCLVLCKLAHRSRAANEKAVCFLSGGVLRQRLISSTAWRVNHTSNVIRLLVFIQCEREMMPVPSSMVTTYTPRNQKSDFLGLFLTLAHVGGGGWCNPP